MNYGQTVGTRALVEESRTKDFCAAKAQSGFSAEQLSGFLDSGLDKLVDLADEQAAIKQWSQLRMEFTDLFCLRRDITYGNRSRKWLMTRALQTRLNRVYVAWREFAIENSANIDIVKALRSKSAIELINAEFKTVLGL